MKEVQSTHPARGPLADAVEQTPPSPERPAAAPSAPTEAVRPTHRSVRVWLGSALVIVGIWMSLGREHERVSPRDLPPPAQAPGHAGEDRLRLLPVDRNARGRPRIRWSGDLPRGGWYEVQIRPEPARENEPPLLVSRPIRGQEWLPDLRHAEPSAQRFRVDVSAFDRRGTMLESDHSVLLLR